VVRLDAGALAAAGALALVALSAVLVPTHPVDRAGWADAILNELIVWFAALYVALTVTFAVLERLMVRRTGGRNPAATTTSPSNRHNLG
jgi:hypothetical protein